MKKYRHKLLIYPILFVVFSSGILIFQSCTNCDSNYIYQPPEAMNDEIIVGSIEQVGMNPKPLEKGMGCIYNNKYDQVHSLLIYKDGMLVFEEYFEGNKYSWDGRHFYGDRILWGKDSMHVIMSCTKSIASACIGIAIDKGYIKNVTESIFNYLPDHQQYKTDGKENITIEHLLTMTSGLEWDEWSGSHSTPDNDIDEIYFNHQSDPVAGVLENELVYKPGEEFTYNGGGTIILGEILRNATNSNIGDFSKEYLFKPLGIDTVFWYRFEDGTFAYDGSLKMTPRDMLKIGVTYLNRGTWNDQRIVSENWIEKSSTPFNNNKGIKLPIDDSGKNGYAYSWWTNTVSGKKGKARLFQAGGWGGQEIIVIPDYNMVVVFTGGNYVVKKHIYKMLERYVIPAIE